MTTYIEAYNELARDTGVLARQLNAADFLCGQHPQDRIALRWCAQDGQTRTYTFGELADKSAQFANLLQRHGVKPGERVAVLLPRTPHLVIALLGVLRLGAVYQPLFTAFGPKAIEHRIQGSEAVVVVTDNDNRDKLDPVPGSHTIICVNNSRDDGIDFDAAIEQEATTFSNVPRSPHDLMLMLFTSGTTGKAKAVSVPLRAMDAFRTYMKYAIDLRDDDVYWNIADPGWAYGLYYGVIGPLLLGQTVTFYNGPFTAESTYEIIRKFGVTNLTGAPTAYRLLIAAGPELAAAASGRVRVISSAGEALNPEVIRWFRENLDCQVHDHYGQTEGGMILANHHGLEHPVVVGSAGLAIPGVAVAILDENSVELGHGQVGELSVDRARSPLYWFEGYGLPTHARVDTPRYHRTGDLAKMDENGTVTFVGRADDVITTSGYRVGPFDVESTLMEHPAVAETAVIGKPDPERTELIKAFVVLKPGYSSEDQLGEELKLFVKRRLAAHAYPREVEFLADLPKTPSGKIQRFVLREREADRAAAAGDAVVVPA